MAYKKLVKVEAFFKKNKDQTFTKYKLRQKLNMGLITLNSCLDYLVKNKTVKKTKKQFDEYGFKN